MRYSEARPEFWVPAEDRPLVQVGKALDYRREMGTEQQSEAARLNIEQAAWSAWTYYSELLEYGVAAEVARTVLPQSTYTTLWLTGNLRSWLSFLDNRMDPHAQWETQDAASKVAEIFAERFPITFEAYMQGRSSGRLVELKAVKS